MIARKKSDYYTKKYDMSNHWEEVRYKMDQKDEARRLYFLYFIWYIAGFAHKISNNFDFDVPEQGILTNEEFSQKKVAL